MASFVFNDAKAGLMNGTIDLDTDVIKVLLVDATFVDTNVDGPFVSSMTPLGELNGTGYVAGHGNAGRKTLTTATVNVDDPNTRGEFHADDVVWTGINAGTINGALIHVEGTTNDTDARVIAFIDLTNTVTNGGDITIAWDAEGIIHLT